MFKESSFELLVGTIQRETGSRPHFVIAISGFGGAGKSTLARKLADVLQKSIIIPADEFITNRLSQRSADWDGFDWDRLVVQVLEPIQQGAVKITYGVYDWPQNKIIQEKSIEVPKYVIVEGVGLVRERLKPFFDLMLWIDIPIDVASERGKTRDREEYKVQHDELWDTIWIPNDNDYFQKHRPNISADIVFTP